MKKKEEARDGVAGAGGVRKQSSEQPGKNVLKKEPACGICTAVSSDGEHQL